MQFVYMEIISIYLSIYLVDTKFVTTHHLHDYLFVDLMRRGTDSLFLFCFCDVKTEKGTNQFFLTLAGFVRERSYSR